MMVSCTGRCEHIEFQKGDKVSGLRATRGSWKICLDWLSLKHTQTCIQFVCVICCHSKLMWFRTHWRLTLEQYAHKTYTNGLNIYVQTYTNALNIAVSPKKSLSLFPLSFSPALKTKWHRHKIVPSACAWQHVNLKSLTKTWTRVVSVSDCHQNAYTGSPSAHC